MELQLPKDHRAPDKFEKYLRKADEENLIKKAERRALKLFHEMARRVPAYKDFLKKKKVDPNKIKTIDDFKTLPLVDKDNYLKKYKREELCWDGKFNEGQWDISSTSGSTGEPFYFPREDSQNQQYAVTAEMYLRTNFQIHKKSTLYINSFALGVWIGGIFTYEALKILARRGGYKLSIINPGLNKAEIIKAVKGLGGQFDQVIIGGYPPFVKDVVDEGFAAGIKWGRYNVKFVFSAEGFSEEFRDYIFEKAKLKNIFRDTLNHYGTVDQGTLAHETPLSILIRRLAMKKPKLFNAVFKESTHRLPTLCQYDPELFFFEEVGSGIVCSSYSGLPLTRYDLKDYGGAVNFNGIVKKFKEQGVDLMEEAKRADIQDTIWHLPFVYVYERKDMTVSLSGANIYPETIRKSLHHKDISKYLTGKFTMTIQDDKNMDQYLEINLEMKKGLKELSKKVKDLTAELIFEKLINDNSEYKSAYYEQGKKGAYPRIVFYPYEHPEYFSGKGKQRWSLK